MGLGVGALWPGQHCRDWGWLGLGPRRSRVLLGRNGLFQGQKDLVALPGFKLKVALSRDAAPACLKGKGYLCRGGKGDDWPGHRVGLLLLDTAPTCKPITSNFRPLGAVLSSRWFSLLPSMCFLISKALSHLPLLSVHPPSHPSMEPGTCFALSNVCHHVPSDFSTSS